MLLIEHDGGWHDRGRYAAKSRSRLERRIVDGRILQPVISQKITGNFRVEVADINSQNCTRTAFGQLGMDVL